MQHDWNFYEAQVAARLTKGFLYRITELVNLPSSRQKNSLFSFHKSIRFFLSFRSLGGSNCLTQAVGGSGVSQACAKQCVSRKLGGTYPVLTVLTFFLMEEVITISVNQVNDHFIFFFFFFGIKSSIHLLLHSFNHSIISLILLLLYRILEGSTVREKRLEILAFRRQDLV